jgi:hypothetical protein
MLSREFPSTPTRPPHFDETSELPVSYSFSPSEVTKEDLSKMIDLLMHDADKQFILHLVLEATENFEHNFLCFLPSDKGLCTLFLAEVRVRLNKKLRDAGLVKEQQFLIPFRRTKPISESLASFFIELTLTQTVAQVAGDFRARGLF